MTDAELREFFESLKTCPESTQNVMELSLDLLIYHFGAEGARGLVLATLDQANARQAQKAKILADHKAHLSNAE